jgi:hypothetical protein
VKSYLSGSRIGKYGQRKRASDEMTNHLQNGQEKPRFHVIQETQRCSTVIEEIYKDDDVEEADASTGFANVQTWCFIRQWPRGFVTIYKTDAPTSMTRHSVPASMVLWQITCVYCRPSMRTVIPGWVPIPCTTTRTALRWRTTCCLLVSWSSLRTWCSLCHPLAELTSTSATISGRRCP